MDYSGLYVGALKRYKPKKIIKIDGKEIIPTTGIFLIHSPDMEYKRIVKSARIESTWRDYVHMLEQGTHKSPDLQEAWDTYNGNLQIKVLEKCYEDELSEKKRFWMYVYGIGIYKDISEKHYKLLQNHRYRYL